MPVLITPSSFKRVFIGDDDVYATQVPAEDLLDVAGEYGPILEVKSSPAGDFVNITGRINNVEGDWQNTKAQGAVQNGTTDDSAALLAAFTATPEFSYIDVPPGNINPGSFAPTSKQVLWKMSGNYSGSGTTPFTGIGNGVIESFLETGGKYFARGSTQSMGTLGGVVRVDMTVNHAGGAAGGLSVFQVNASNTAASTPGQSLIAGNFNVTANRTGNTTQNIVAIQAAAVRDVNAGNTQPFGGNIYAYDQTLGTSADKGSIVGCEFDVLANNLDNGTAADGANVGSGPNSGAQRIGVDIKVGRFDRNVLANVEFANAVNIGAVDTDISWVYAKNAINCTLQITFAGLNFRRATFGASANGALFQVSANSTLAWTADSLAGVPTNYTTIKGTGTAGDLGLQYTPIGTGTNQLDVSATSPRFQVGTTAGPSWTTGAGVPGGTEPRGSLYSRTGGGVGTTLYVSQGGGTWNAVALV